MIERMLKVYCAVKSQDRERLLKALRDLGVMHLLPVAADKAVPGDDIDAALDQYKRALQIIGSYAGAAAKETPADEAGSVDQQVQAILQTQRTLVEAENKLSALYRQLEGLSLWGDTTLAQMDTLKQAGITPAFYIVPDTLLGQMQAECVQVVGKPAKNKSLIALIDRTGEVVLPDGVEAVPLPKTDRPAIRAEAAEIDAAVKADRVRLGELAKGKDAIQAALKTLEEQARYNIAMGGALDAEGVFAVQGWIAAPGEARLTEGLTQVDFAVGIKVQPPEEDEDPPTLIRYPGWIKPIKGLFDILGTLPGYKEIDLAPFFMLAMPLFAAILIGDAGYGLIFILASVGLWKKAVATGAKEKIQLLLWIGIVTFVWGILTGSFFGMGPVDFLKAGGMWEGVGKGFNQGVVFGRLQAVDIDQALSAADKDARLVALTVLSKQAMEGLQKGLMVFSFILAVAHLVSARLREALALFPDQRALASMGWAVVLCSMFSLIWMLFFNPNLSPWLIMGFLIPGLVLTICFSVPSKNIAKRLSLGMASSLLPTISAFSDMMSYIRLMAVAMASVFIGQVFNMLGAQLADATTWALGGPVIVMGHALNIALCLIAIFAHGVRLNMLEFSNNAGVQWGGYPFKPFAKLMKD